METYKKVRMEKEKCLRCGYKWYKRIPGRPERCPKCNSPYWDKEKKIFKKGK